MAGLERTLVLRFLGYFEPGTAAAAANGVRQPFCSRDGARSPLFPGLSHRLTPGCCRLLFAVRFFGGSSHPSIKNYGNIPAQDYGVPYEAGCFFGREGHTLQT